MAKRQILSDESVNSKGFIVLNEGLDWSRYRKNPVLLVEHVEDSVPIGKIVDIRLDNGAWTGELVFADTERGQEAKRLYDEGMYNGVSINGLAHKVKRNDKVYAVKFKVFETSLVAIPANENAVSYETERLNVIFNDAHGEQWRESLSASENESINNYLMENEEKKIDEVQEELAAQAAVEDTEKVDEQAEELSAKTETEEKEPGYVKTILSAIANAFKPKEEAVEETKEELAAEPAVEEEKVELSVAEDAKVFEKPKTTVKVKNMKAESLNKWLNSDEGQFKMGEVVKLSNKAARDPQAATHPDNASAVENLREFGHKLASDPAAMEFTKEVRFDVNGGRSESVGQMAERLSSGENTVDFVNNNPDLAKAVWLSMFLQQLLPENSWAARTMKASGADKAGMIWVQSAINPAIYMGNRAPLNAANYMYDDVARGLTTKVFSVQPVLWQPSNTDLLAYNDQATGMAEITRLVAEAIHQYTLQVAAEEAGETVTMTGTDIAAAGWFPNLNPAAAGNISSLSVQDLALLTAKFINENFAMDMYQGALVLDARYAAAFKTDTAVTSVLMKNAGQVNTRFTQFDAWDIYSRSRVIGYDTAASAIIDPEWYLDGKVNADGSIPAYTAPVIPATTYGAGLAFMPNQIIMALGNTNVHMVSDPNNYGWKVSSDIRFGAGVVRADGKGVKVIAPAAGA
jgi:hypothetical protein